MPNCNAFIFARGGSKRLPGKNIKELLGKPLLAYAIEQAQASRYINKVIVSTDCSLIKRVATIYGAEILDRPDDLAGDGSPELLSWKHALFNYPCDIFVSIPATCPFRETANIDLCIESLNDNDMAIAVQESKSNPFFNQGTIENGLFRFLHQPVDRSQDAPKMYDISGAVYVANSRFILETDSLWHGEIKPVVLPFAVDIDTYTDFLMAESLIRHHNRAASVMNEDTSAA